MFRVVFGDCYFHIWEEVFKTYTAAWIAYQTAQQIRDPKRIALRFPGN